MDITIERESEVAIFKVPGRIDSANALEFQDDLQKNIQESDRVVILDFADLSYISSAGLRVILMVTKELARRNAKLAICSLSELVNEVFQVSGFDKIITVRRSKEEAINSVR